MHRRVVSVFAASWSFVGCAHARPAWDPNAPLAPPIVFAEAVPPRTIVLLALDAHSGAVLHEARALIPDAQLAPLPDSLGRFHFPALSPGPHRLRVVAIGYAGWQSTVVISDSAGQAFVVQLRRSTLPLTPVVAGTQPP
jgi:hypothetical protein